MEFYKEKFKEIRKREGLSLAKTADLLGKTLRTVFSWESGERVPSKSNILLIARMFNIDLYEISDLKEKILPKREVPDSVSDAMQEFKHLKIEDQARIERVLHSLSKTKNENKIIKAELNRYSTTLNAVQSYVYTKDNNLFFTFVNADFLNVLDRERSSMMGKHNSAIFSPKNAVPLDELEKRVLKGEHLNKVKINIPGKRNRKGLFSACTIVDDRTMKAVGITVSIEDITDRTNATDNYEILETAVNSSREILWIRKNNLERSAKYVSDGVAELSGYTREDFYNNPTFWINNVVHSDDRENVHNYYQDESCSSSIEYKIQTKEKQLKYVSEQRYQMEKHNLTFSIIRDITEKKES